MEKFRNKYRIKSTRAAWWNYSWPGAYFITLNTKNREWLFGRVVNKILILSPIGEIVRKEWEKSFQIRKELICEEFVIMPDHLHAIVCIIENINSVETHGRASRLNSRLYREKKSISSFVAGFKSAATKLINEFRNTPKLPVWQSLFHDHIIRNEKEFRRIKWYIINNPANWKINNNQGTRS